ncbi:hypothetical protein VHEMI01379 [[Torrubiella] hemipterigena]|uniref:Major facilitator superfamily (MFS) profile domain-containing protein n=1 Tax=[Torrubiella] hemipterigena TaxID=1531966 RepID=A0A0A1T7C2_9HYPO|nr:hypothetical protein VHEMI01379 [[Torrubiella] hemipterigena]
MGERAAIVPRLMKNHRITINQLVVFFNSGGLFVLIYYLPIYFQSVRNDTPIQSGVYNLPFHIGGIFSMASGFVLGSTNQWVPYLIGSAALSAVGSGLIYTFTPDTLTATWAGYQILAGAATGFLSQLPIMSNTACVDMTEMSTMSAMTLFFQIIGCSFSVSAAQSIFGNTLPKRLAETAPEIDRTTILSVGASQLRNTFSEQQLPVVILAYMDALKGTFALATAMFAISALLAVMHKWEALRTEVPVDIAAPEKHIAVASASIRSADAV